MLGVLIFKFFIYKHLGIPIIIIIKIHINAIIGNMYTGLNDGRIVTFNDTDITTVLHMGPPPYDKCGKIYTHTHTPTLNINWISITNKH